MDDNHFDQPEQLMKSDERVKKHGEVFTPSWMVQKMLDTPGIKEAAENITATFLEPAAGDGNFLVAILERKLKAVEEEYLNTTLIEYENYSLLALSTLYGIELLEDNAQMCVMNLASKYQKEYTRIAELFGEEPKDNILKSAHTIISKNIVNGDFLTRKTSNGLEITFTEYQVSQVTELGELEVELTEYTLNEIYEYSASDVNPTQDDSRKTALYEDFDLFADFDFETGAEVQLKPKYPYTSGIITDIYGKVRESNDYS